MDNYSIFISYAREDHAAALRLYQDLKRVGLNPWLDTEGLIPGQRWKTTITQAIHNSRYFIALLSSSSVSGKGFVNKEIAEALESLEMYPDSEVFLLPIRLNECQPAHARLSDLHWVDMFPSWDEGLIKILNAFAGGQPGISLRSHTLSLSEHAASEMIRERGFYEVGENPTGRGIKHEYVLQSDNRIVLDKTTGLFWKRTAYKSVSLDGAREYLKALNQEKYCGFEDWRLPTLEEAMSLVEPQEYGEAGFYLAPVFQGAAWIWTADLSGKRDEGAWIVFYNSGSCGACYINGGKYCVMPVR